MDHSAIVAALVNYSLRAAWQVVPKIGESAYRLLTLLNKTILDHVASRGESGAVLADEFRKDPRTYESPMAKLVAAALADDEGLAKEVKRIIGEYNRAVSPGQDGDNHRIDVSGRINAVGSAFGGGSVSAGGDIVGGSKA
ncbi:hypothetical protein PHYC_03273 [Phycisphaerales bacterium]|nr:hypothetical protein PHYC_03273 [Phycisphaerales bacterium]